MSIDPGIELGVRVRVNVRVRVRVRASAWAMAHVRVRGRGRGRVAFDGLARFQLVHRTLGTAVQSSTRVRVTGYCGCPVVYCRG